jgi:hypothetical protein
VRTVSDVPSTKLFQNRPELVPDDDALLTAARTDASRQVTIKAHELAHSVALLDLAAPSGEFSELAAESAVTAETFSPSYPNIRLLNVSSMLHRIALISGLHPLVETELQEVSTAQDLLDEACYVHRQYNKATCPPAVLAAAVRTGHWRNLSLLARTVQLDAVLRIDTTASERFAQEVGCQRQLVLALGRLSVFDAVTAAFCVNFPPNSPAVQHTPLGVSVRI